MQNLSRLILDADSTTKVTVPGLVGQVVGLVRGRGQRFVPELEDGLGHVLDNIRVAPLYGNQGLGEVLLGRGVGAGEVPEGNGVLKGVKFMV